jgi:hypothetical protein
MPTNRASFPMEVDWNYVVKLFFMLISMKKNSHFHFMNWHHNLIFCLVDLLLIHLNHFFQLKI